MTVKERALTMILKRGVTGFTAEDLSLERDWSAHTAEFKNIATRMFSN